MFPLLNCQKAYLSWEHRLQLGERPAMPDISGLAASGSETVEKDCTVDHAHVQAWLIADN